MKCNFFTWVLETSSILVVIVSSKPHATTTILYILCVSCGPPLLYFMGIEENRRAAEEYIKANIRVFHKISKTKVEDEETSEPNNRDDEELGKYENIRV